METGQGTVATKREDRSEKVDHGHEEQKRIKIGDCKEIYNKQAPSEVS